MLETITTETYMDRNIKDVLSEFPQLGDVLADYGIGCVTCSVGTCLLKDIVKIHSLPDNQMLELMHRIARTVGLEEEDIQPLAVEKASLPVIPKELKYSPPMHDLVEEHKLIKRLLALIPSIIARVDLNTKADRELIYDCVTFIRSYADRFHHAKEEDILFKRFTENKEILRIDEVIRIMLEDHQTGRNHVKAIVVAVEKRDKEMLAEHLEGYRELLSGHIKKEDEVLYPWMDRQLTTSQVGELFAEFCRADSRFDPGMREKFEKFIERLEREGGKL